MATNKNPGSTSVPVYSFDNDTNAGIFSTVTDGIGLSSNSSRVVHSTSGFKTLAEMDMHNWLLFFRANNIMFDFTFDECKKWSDMDEDMWDLLERDVPQAIEFIKQNKEKYLCINALKEP